MSLKGRDRKCAVAAGWAVQRSTEHRRPRVLARDDNGPRLGMVLAGDSSVNLLKITELYI
jgi:hypothetical protein